MDGKPSTDRASTIRLALTSMGAAGVEWYDFFVYGTAAALVFPHIFFSPDLSPVVAQLAAFSTFAVGFIARPLGGVVFGHFGDLHGRKKTLVAALLTMGVSTLLVGILPTYQSVGAAAPLALIFLRFVQGFAVGGQWGAAALIAIENAPEGRRGLFGSFVQIGVPAGVVLANIVFVLTDGMMSREAFEAWGWRIPFLLSLVVIGLALYVQLRMEESREFEKLAAKRKAAGTKAGRQKSPILEVIASSWGQILLAGGAFIASNACFYVIITWVIAYGTTTLALSREMILGCIMFGSVCMIPAPLRSHRAVWHFPRRLHHHRHLVLCLLPLVGNGHGPRCRGRDCDRSLFRRDDVRPAGRPVCRIILDRGPLFRGHTRLSGRGAARRRIHADDRNSAVCLIRNQPVGGVLHGGLLPDLGDMCLLPAPAADERYLHPKRADAGHGRPGEQIVGLPGRIKHRGLIVPMIVLPACACTSGSAAMQTETQATPLTSRSFMQPVEAARSDTLARFNPPSARSCARGLRHLGSGSACAPRLFGPGPMNSLPGGTALDQDLATIRGKSEQTIIINAHALG